MQQNQETVSDKTEAKMGELKLLRGFAGRTGGQGSQQ